MKNELQLCTYDQSKKLKQLGFDWYTPASYLDKGLVKELGWCNKWKTHDPEHKIGIEMQKSQLVSCPSTTIVVKWLRETKRAILQVAPIDDWTAWNYGVLYPDIMSPFFVVNFVTNYPLDGYPTFEAAELAGIDFILKDLTK